MIDNQTHTDMEILPFEQWTEEEQLFTYISDTHKSAYGYRPRGKYNGLSVEELREELEFLRGVAQEQMNYEKQMERESYERFLSNLQSVIESGAGDEETALRWMIEAEDDLMDAGHFMWRHGFSQYSDYGRELKQKIEPLITY